VFIELLLFYLHPSHLKSKGCTINSLPLAFAGIAFTFACVAYLSYP